MKARLPIRMQIAVLAVAGIFPWFTAGAQGSLQSQLEAKYKITKPTDDKSDIVTAGAVLVLQKDKLLMYPTSTQIPPQNTYSGGRLSEGAYGVHQKMQSFGSMIGHPPPQTVQGRQFVTGEKFWVTGIVVQPDGVLFTLVQRSLSRCSVLLDAQVHLPERLESQLGSGVEHGRGSLES